MELGHEHRVFGHPLLNPSPIFHWKLDHKLHPRRDMGNPLEKMTRNVDQKDQTEDMHVVNIQFDSAHTRVHQPEKCESIFSREVLRLSNLLQAVQVNETDGTGRSEENDVVQETDNEEEEGGDGYNIQNRVCMSRGNC